MRPRGVAAVFRQLWVLGLFLFIAPFPADAANHYVRAGATGAASGADWTNAYTDLPASLTRGDLYYVAAGTYGRHTFNDAFSGTSVIEIRAATVADHGTDTGWSAGFVGEALFQCVATCTRVWDFGDPTGYYKFNGVYRNANWQSGYGIRVSCANKLCSDSVIGMGGYDSGHTFHDFTFTYLNIDGSHAATDSDPPEVGFLSIQGYNLTLDHSYVHDVGTSPLFLGGCGASCGSSGWNFGDNLLVQYSYFSGFGGWWSGSGRHTELVFRDAIKTVTFRWNYVEGCGSTACLATPSGGTQNTGNSRNGPWQFYGNVFYIKNGQTHCAGGQGVFLGVGGISWDANVYFMNNTIANFQQGSCTATIGTSLIQGGTWCLGANANCTQAAAGPFTMYVESNLLWNSYGAGGAMFGVMSDPGCTSDPSTNCGTLLSGTLTWGYMDYWMNGVAGDISKDVSTTKTSHATGNPFTNWTNNTPGSDFTLLANTSAGMNTHSLVPGNDVDMNGVTRTTWTRGAFEFVGTPPLPPKNLRFGP